MATAPSSGRWWLAIVLVAVLAVAIAAIALATRAPGPPSPSTSPGATSVALASASPCPTPAASGGVPASAAAACAAPVAGAGGGAVGGGAAGGGGNGGGAAGGGSGGAGASPVATDQPSPTASPTLLADVGGPYLVKQIETLGGEAISGIVCSTAQPFAVAAHTSKVAWTFLFVPLDRAHGAVSYAYSIPSAGESHTATGTYSIGAAAVATTLEVSFTVSDHVVFRGFDGNIPERYKFDLVPQSGAPGCPGA